MGEERQEGRQSGGRGGESGEREDRDRIGDYLHEPEEVLFYAINAQPQGARDIIEFNIASALAAKQPAPKQPKRGR